MQKVNEWKSEKDELEKLALMKGSRERITKAINNAKVKLTWSYAPEWTGAFTQMDWNYTLLSKINEANKGFEGRNIICSSEVVAVLQDMVYFENTMEEIITELKVAPGMYYAGTLASRYHVTIDPYLPEQYLLIVKDDFWTSSNPECVLVIVTNIPTFK